jgi:MEMO1 family protein
MPRNRHAPVAYHSFLMSSPLARLRIDLDFMPSPVEDRPGLLIRDPFQYSDAVLILPPPIVPLLDLFDGVATELDLREALVQISGQFDVSDLLKQLTGSLSDAGFLHDDVFAALRDAKHKDFADAVVRVPAHAGSAYSDDPAEMKATFSDYMQGATQPEGKLVAIAAPHVSPEGGIASYRDAYSAIGPELRDKTFIILGTSHYGAPEKFGLTRKDFLTPLGRARTDTKLVEELTAAAPSGIVTEDYVHSTEHSIEFQAAFLQHRVAPDVRIVPILCGSFSKSLYEGGLPEDDEGVRRFFGALGDIAAREADRLVFVLGVDMAHMGRRYGDSFDATAGAGEMTSIETRDRARIASIASSDARGFWDQVQHHEDDLKWCGSSPFYTFLKTVPGLKANLRRYEQWNIDPQSVVSFGAMTFVK